MAASQASPTTDATAASASGHGLGIWLWTMRIFALINALLVLLQPVLAGLYLDGEFDLMKWHGTLGSVLIGLLMFQGIAALLFWRPGRGSIWPFAVTVVLWFAASMQVGMGYLRVLGIHVPLGVLIIAAQLILTWWMFTARARATQKAQTPAAPLAPQW